MIRYKSLRKRTSIGSYYDEKSLTKCYWDGVYGYCVCGREVQHSAKKIDEKCPLCRATLVWDLSDKKLWHNGKEN